MVILNGNIKNHYIKSFKLTYTNKVYNIIQKYDMIYSVLFLNATRYYHYSKKEIKYPYVVYYSHEDVEINFYIDNEYFVLDLGVDLYGNYSYYSYRRSDKLELFCDDKPIENISTDIFCNMLNNRFLT